MQPIGGHICFKDDIVSNLPDFLKYYAMVKFFDNDRYGAIYPFLFTDAIITGRLSDCFGYDNRWCYEKDGRAYKILEAWDGTAEPEGWHRHPESGRRRPGGDAELEFIRF